jgi:hypothetical protein
MMMEEHIMELPDVMWVCPMQDGNWFDNIDECPERHELTQEDIDEHIADGGINGDKMKPCQACRDRCYGDPCLAVKYVKEQS